jgi:hypothetical protein
VAALVEGFGRHNYYVTLEEQVDIFRHLFGQDLLGPWVSCLARVSIALILLQFDSSVLWRVTFWAAICFQISVALTVNVTLLLSCRPIRALWDDVPNATCWTPQQNFISSITNTGKY